MSAGRARLRSGCPISLPIEIYDQRLTQHIVLLHKGLSIYPLVNFRTSLVQPGPEWIGKFTDRVADWRPGITENDLCVRNERREDGREEDERQQTEYLHRCDGGNWTTSAHSVGTNVPYSIPFLEEMPPLLITLTIRTIHLFAFPLTPIVYPIKSTFK